MLCNDGAFWHRLEQMIGKKVKTLTTVYDDPLYSGEYRLDFEGRRESLPPGSVGTVVNTDVGGWTGTPIVIVLFTNGIRAALGRSAYVVLEDDQAV